MKEVGRWRTLSLSRIIAHIIFSTKERWPFIEREVEGELHAYMASVADACGCQAILINGTEDHVHILCVLSRTIPLCDLVEEVKKRSSKWIKTKGRELTRFAWQGGYGAFSLGESNVEAARRYIRNQKEHHRTVTFQEEYRAFLKRYHIEYDERYIWD
ncbi:MAG: IS200/IS605 family transposase [Planctomycetota bacterium]|nr:IS200/IS605 family transposase [Planctomycetota bacterium]